jgi:hypothetical protein
MALIFDDIEAHIAAKQADSVGEFERRVVRAIKVVFPGVRASARSLEDFRRECEDFPAHLGVARVKWDIHSVFNKAKSTKLFKMFEEFVGEDEPSTCTPVPSALAVPAPAGGTIWVVHNLWHMQGAPDCVHLRWPDEKAGRGLTMCRFNAFLEGVRRNGWSP